jgi:hypothetical protein
MYERIAVTITSTSTLKTTWERVVATLCASKSPKDTFLIIKYIIPQQA